MAEMFGVRGCLLLFTLSYNIGCWGGGTQKGKEKRQYEAVNRAGPEWEWGVTPALGKEMCQHAHCIALLSPPLGYDHT